VCRAAATATARQQQRPKAAESSKQAQYHPWINVYYAIPEGVDGFPAKQKAKNAPNRPGTHFFGAFPEGVDGFPTRKS